MEAIKGLNVVLRFLLELGLLAALGSWGYSLSSSTPLQWLAALGLPLVTAAVWGCFVAPKARYLAPPPYRLVIELVLFGVATAGLIQSGHGKLGLVYALLVVINEILLLAWKQ